MNIGQFKEIVSTWENSEEKFRLFRVWTENCCFAYEENYNYELSMQNGQPSTNMEYIGTFVDYDTVLMIYNKMGWKLEGKAKEIKDFEYKTYHGTLLSRGIAFQCLYERIQAIKDNIEFAYAIILVTTGDIGDDLSDLAEIIYEGLREYDLLSIVDMVDINKKKKVFIAMSFDDSMKQARENIIGAVHSCGYASVLIDVKEHNNQIVPEIHKEINDSKFVIADLTGQRGGVYYEAGYAVAKGKELILCCKKGENPHFDVAQINTIFWIDERDLKERLIKRIEATVKRNE